jgi:ribose-phosphate pyrophosphokinase
MPEGKFTIIADSAGYHYLKYNKIVFSGGEVQVKLDLAGVDPTIPFNTKLPVKITIGAHITDSEGVMELVMLTDAIKREFQDIRTLVLVLPYLPYARQDRVCARGEALSVKVFAGILNDLEFDKVTVWDCHSPTGLAVIENVENIPQTELLKGILGNSDLPLERTVLVAPDAGSIKKVSDLAQEYALPMVRADKNRDVQTGKITETVVYSEHIGDRDFLIVDDICDGGRTFIELAKVLRPLTNGKVKLYVTHGIFSQGLTVFEGLIDEIYTARAFPNVNTEHPLLKCLTK